MATNTYAPQGLSVGGARNIISAAGNYAHQLTPVKAGYTNAIGRGDLVNMGTAANQGYLVISALADTHGLGVFITVYPYYDLTAQQVMHGLVGSYPTTANPSATGIQCAVIADPFVTFIAQVQGSTGWDQTWQGQNINFVAATNGVPNASGQSTLALDPASINTTNTLPLRIVGPAGVTGGPKDPANVNPWIEVRLNTSWLLSSAGI